MIKIPDFWASPDINDCFTCLFSTNWIDDLHQNSLQSGSRQFEGTVSMLSLKAR